MQLEGKQELAGEMQPATQKRFGRADLAAVERTPGLHVDAHLEVGLRGAPLAPDEHAVRDLHREGAALLALEIEDEQRRGVAQALAPLVIFGDPRRKPGREELPR